MNLQVQNSMAPIRFRFEHLGPVKSADLELGHLTIIAGRNNTGKTYIVYTIYALLKNFLRNPWGQKVGPSTYSTWIEKLAADARMKGVEKRRLNSTQIISHRSELLSEYSNFFSEYLLADVFSSRRDDFSGSRVSIDLSDSASSIKENMKALSHEFPRDHRRYPIRYDGSSILISLPMSLLRRAGYTFHREFIVGHYRRILLPELFSNVSIISAERFGISLFYKELDFTKNQLVEALQRLRDKEHSSDEILYLLSDRASSRYALPIKDNIHFTRSIAQIKSEESDLYGEKLFERIERLLDGSYSASDDEFRFHSMQTHESDPQDSAFDIPLHLASSSARGLSDLYFFLKHQASRNHLLIIDEPESHLDTSNQVKLARMLAHFVRAGVRVLITTHSDYLLKEFNNLIMLSRDFKDKENVREALGYSEDDFLDPKSIRAYIAENGGLTPCKIDSIGIDFPLFDQVIDTINRATNELVSRMDR